MIEEKVIYEQRNIKVTNMLVLFATLFPEEKTPPQDEMGEIKDEPNQE